MIHRNEVDVRADHHIITNILSSITRLKTKLCQPAGIYYQVKRCRSPSIPVEVSPNRSVAAIKYGKRGISYGSSLKTSPQRLENLYRRWESVSPVNPVFEGIGFVKFFAEAHCPQSPLCQFRRFPRAAPSVGVSSLRWSNPRWKHAACPISSPHISRTVGVPLR